MLELSNQLKSHIGTIKEKSLHRELKDLYKTSNGKLEVKVGSYFIDLVRNGILIEIQSRNFSAIKNKLEDLLENHRILLVHPIIRDKWIKNVDMKTNKIIRRQLSPKHCSYENIFEELIYFPRLLYHPNLILELILIQAEEIRINDGNGTWRRGGWSINDLKLIKILEHKIFSNPKQLLELLPPNLESPFTNNDLADYLKKPIKLARMMTYCYRKMGLIKVVGKKQRFLSFKLVSKFNH